MGRKGFEIEIFEGDRFWGVKKFKLGSCKTKFVLNRPQQVFSSLPFDEQIPLQIKFRLKTCFMTCEQFYKLPALEKCLRFRRFFGRRELKMFLHLWSHKTATWIASDGAKSWQDRVQLFQVLFCGKPHRWWRFKACVLHD